MTTFRLTEREVARRLGQVQATAEWWGWKRLEASAKGDDAGHQAAFQRQQAALLAVPALRGMLAAIRAEAVAA